MKHPKSKDSILASKSLNKSAALAITAISLGLSIGSITLYRHFGLEIPIIANILSAFPITTTLLNIIKSEKQNDQDEQYRLYHDTVKPNQIRYSILHKFEDDLEPQNPFIEQNEYDPNKHTALVLEIKNQWVKYLEDNREYHKPLKRFLDHFPLIKSEPRQDKLNIL